MKKDYRTVLVVWEDAEEHGDVGWNNLKDQLKYAKKPCPVMRTVGFEIYKNEKHIALLSSMGNIECSTVEKIPMSFVIEITPLIPAENTRDAKRNQVKKH